MRTTLLRSALLALTLSSAVALFAADQPAGFSRKVLVEQDLSTPGKHGAVALIEFGPSAVAPKHTHPGEEMGYVLEGTLSLEIDGQPARTVKTGDSFIIPAGVAHLARNLAATPAKILSSYFIEKGQPLASPAK